MVDFSGWDQPNLFDTSRALRLVFEALIDPEERTVVFSVEAREYPSRRLVALSSSSPVGWENVDGTARDFGQRFTTLLRAETGPFT